MKNKKAMLLASETLKIVLSVIAIAILAYLLFALYTAGTKSEKLEHAKATMEQMSKIITQLKLNSSYPGDVDQITPLGWSIFSFVQKDVKPNPCSGQDCLCICDSVSDFGGLIKNRQENECGKFGTCLIVGDLQKFQEILIERNGGAFTSIEIKKPGKWVEVVKK